MINVIITGVGGGVGYAIIKALRSSTLDLHIIGVDANPWAGGIYRCDRGYLVPPANDPDYPAAIINICKQENAQILFPGNEAELPVLARLKTQLAVFGCQVVCGSEQSIRITRNKFATAAFFQAVKLPFVATAKLAKIDQLITAKGFPVIIKPISGATSKEINVCFNRKQVTEFINHTADTAMKNYIAQEYIVPAVWLKDKTEIDATDIYNGDVLKQQDEVSIQVLVGNDGEIFGCFTSINVLRHGVPIKILPEKGHPAEPVAIKMAKALYGRGFTGPCNLQCRITKEGPVFFEVNPRFTNITGARVAMGFNECEAYIRHLVLNEALLTIQKSLDYDGTMMCSRFEGDIVFPKADFNLLQTNGSVVGKGVVTKI